MSATTGHTIVETAIQLSMELPNKPALEVLDLAMRGHNSTEPDFATDAPAYRDALRPPSPFLDFVRRALDPQWDPRDMMLLAAAEPANPDQQARFATAKTRREALVQAFGMRYKLWGLGQEEAPKPDMLPRELRYGVTSYSNGQLMRELQDQANALVQVAGLGAPVVQGNGQGISQA